MNNLKKIKDENYAIYGTGELAQAIKKYITKKRPYATLAFYIDTFKDGKTPDGLEIIRADKLKERINDVKTIVIASYSNCEPMKNIALAYGAKNCILVEEKFAKKAFREKFEKVKKILKTKKDKKLYDILINAYETHDMRKLKTYIDKNLKISVCAREDNLHYLKYINIGAIETVFDCGGFNGYNSIVFENEFKNAKDIYCFEPLYDQFLNKDYDSKNAADNFIFSDIVKNSKKIQIIKSAVSDKKSVMNFLINTCLTGASAIEGFKTETDCHIKTQVDVTTIDIFCKENNISKVDYIKMDIEGAELKALEGAKATLIKDRPQLAISLYHSKKHLYEIPLYLNSILKNYVYHIEHHAKTLAESVLYAIPKEIYKKTKN